jgi:hypothetical protein
VCDSAVEGEGGGERGALLFAEWGEVWIGERVVCCVEVVVTLCVLNFERVSVVSRIYFQGRRAGGGSEA